MICARHGHRRDYCRAGFFNVRAASESVAPVVITSSRMASVAPVRLVSHSNAPRTFLSRASRSKTRLRWCISALYELAGEFDVVGEPQPAS